MSFWPVLYQMPPKVMVSKKRARFTDSPPAKSIVSFAPERRSWNFSTPPPAAVLNVRSKYSGAVTVSVPAASAVVSPGALPFPNVAKKK